MLRDLVESCQPWGIRFERKKFEWMAIGTGEVMDTQWGLVRSQARGMSILGHWVPRFASDLVDTAGYRIRQGWQHWNSRKRELTTRYVPLRRRVERWRVTVQRTVLWGCGSWVYSQPVAQKVQAATCNMV